MARPESKSKQKTSISKEERERILVDLMLGVTPHEVHGGWPDAGLYDVVRTETGEPFPVSVAENGVLCQVPKIVVVGSILNWATRLSVQFALRTSDAKSVYEAWLSRKGGIEVGKVKDVAQKSEGGYCWRRLDWDLEEEKGKPTVVWDAILERMTHAQEFKAWIGGLLVPDSYMQQYCWLKGGGKDGKGSIISCLEWVFGDAFSSLEPPEGGNRFWNNNLVGKRIVAFPDIENSGFVVGGKFKALSGGDPIAVEIKGGATFRYRPKAKYLFASQNSPGVSSDRADSRRLIFCEFHTPGPDKIDPQFQTKLRAEAGAFLAGCLDAYKDLCPEHGAIEVLESSFDDLSDEEDHFEAVFQKYFATVQPVSGAENVKIEEDKQYEFWVPARLMALIMQDEFRNNTSKSAREFRSWISRKKGVRKQVVRVYKNGIISDTLKVFTGVILSPDNVDIAKGNYELRSKK